MVGRMDRIGAGALLAGMTLLASLPASAQLIYYAAPSAGVVGTVAPVFVAPPQPVVAAPVVAAPAAPAPTVAMPVVMMPMASTEPVVRSYYRVKKGGRLLTVAKKYGVTFADLVRLNPTLDAERSLPAGTMIALPVP